MTDIADVIAYIKANLTLDSDTKSEYCGGAGSGRMYRDYTTIKLVLDGECIGDVSINV